MNSVSVIYRHLVIKCKWVEHLMTFLPVELHNISIILNFEYISTYRSSRRLATAFLRRMSFNALVVGTMITLLAAILLAPRFSLKMLVLMSLIALKRFLFDVLNKKECILWIQMWNTNKGKWSSWCFKRQTQYLKRISFIQCLVY